MNRQFSKKGDTQMITVRQKALLVVLILALFVFVSVSWPKPPTPEAATKTPEGQILESARDVALSALATHDRCAGLFNWPTASNGHDPSRVLKNLLNHYRTSVGLEPGVFLTTAPLENDASGNLHTAVTQLSQLKSIKGEIVGIQVLVVVNSDPRSFFAQSANEQAVLLLHELGHIFSDLWGSGSTLIRKDSQRPEQSFENTRLVRTSCEL
jgi:hypothetical protein